jgi:hypothetical protein
MQIPKSADCGLILRFFGFEHHFMACSGWWPIAFLPTPSFSCGSGVSSWCARLQQKCQSRTLYLGRGQWAHLSILVTWMPGWAIGLNQIAHEQQLPISQRTQPHPLLGTYQIRRTVAIGAHVLFEKAEQMLNGKTPQVHPAQVLQRHAFGTCPKQPDGTFVTRCAILFQKLYAHNCSHQAGQTLEVQLTPGTYTHFLFAQVEFCAGIRRAGDGAQLKVCSMLARRTPTAFGFGHRCFAQFLIVL